jgi:diguanylate cyclase (GGDEF)-like protein
MKGVKQQLKGFCQWEWLSRYLPTLLSVGIGLVLSGVGFEAIARWQRSMQMADLEAKTQNVARAVETQIDAHLQGIWSIGDVLALGKGSFQPQGFETLARHFIARHSGVEALMWAPRIDRERRSDYERAMGERLGRAVTLSEGRSPAFPVSAIEPSTQRGFSLGLDLTTIAAFEDAIARSVQSQQAAVSFEPTPGNPYGSFAAIVPIYDADDELLGLAIALFDSGRLLKQAFKGIPLDEIDVVFSEPRRSPQIQWLTLYRSDLEQTYAEPEIQGKIAHLIRRDACSVPARCRYPVVIAGHEAIVQLLPKTTQSPFNAPLLAWIFLGAGLSLTAIVVAYLAEVQKRSAHLQHQIQDLSQANFELTRLNRIGDLLQACVTLEEAYETIPRLVEKLFPEQAGSLYILSASGNVLEAVSSWGEPTGSELVFGPDECWAIRSGRPHIFEKKHSGLACAHLRHPFPSMCLCIPMMAQGETLGLLYLSSRQRNGLSESKQELADNFAERLGLALANLKLREKLKNQSIRDPLTGLFNRRYLEESLERELYRATREQQGLGVILLDIDHFKQFNDTFGHDAGDTLLKELAMFLQGNIRQSDIACRYGGEEFVLIVPDASLDTIVDRAELLRQGVKHLHVQYHRESLGTISLSFGVACFPQNGKSASGLIEAADAALYEAKAQGRDRVAISSSGSTDL